MSGNKKQPQTGGGGGFTPIGGGHLKGLVRIESLDLPKLQEAIEEITSAHGGAEVQRDSESSLTITPNAVASSDKIKEALERVAREKGVEAEVTVSK